MSHQRADARKRTQTVRHYIGPDAYGDPTIWRDHGPEDERPHALLTRTEASGELFDLVAGLLRGAL